ncbi:MAG: hypothetical protein EPO06_11910 [Burkholderiaceae bacterium]|nr:MAG: hypothetical protein EPO06_11910 [Burkholderiaceae bacterium]
MDTAPPTGEAVHLTAVIAAARHRNCFYTAVALRDAADLLADLYATGQRHGMPPGRWDVDLPGACVDALTVMYMRAVPRETADAVLLLDVAADKLTEAGLPCRRQPGSIRVEVPSPAGEPVALTLDPGGWNLRRAEGRTQIVSVEAPFSVHGACAVAILVEAVARGEHGARNGHPWPRFDLPTGM